jgi:hypothetical protein
MILGSQEVNFLACKNPSAPLEGIIIVADFTFPGLSSQQEDFFIF